MARVGLLLCWFISSSPCHVYRIADCDHESSQGRGEYIHHLWMGENILSEFSIT
jgi:hypothetical protein